MIVLSIGAHPDDETCCAGTLIKYAQEGHAVYILTTTRGEGGSTGVPPVCERPELGRVREQEGRDAGAVIGARQVIYLPYVDPNATDGITKAIDATLDEFAASIQAVLEHLRPDVIITHGTDGEYGHPQHIFTQQATFQALRNLAAAEPAWRPQEVLTWCAAYPNPEVPAETNQSDPADLFVDIRPYAARKLEAFMQHRSQYYGVTSYFKDKGGAFMAEKIEAFRRWPELCRAAA
jgi:LmbE family N-acetylglucosaminyl deacetylase